MIAVQKTHRAVLVMEIVMDSMIVRDRSLVGRKTVHGEMRMIVAEQVGNLLYALCVVWISFNITLSDKISADKIFGTKSKFRQFCPTKLLYNSQEKYVLT